MGKPRLSEREMNDTLAHVGVLGMKWGVRRKILASPEHEEVKALMKKNRKNLSNAEIKKINDRLSLEQNNLNLKLQNSTKVFTVIKAVTAAGATIAGAYALVKSDAGQKAIARVRKIIATAKDAKGFVDGAGI